MALQASLLRTREGAATRGIWLPKPTSAWSIPDVPVPQYYPRANYSEIWKIIGATSSTTLWEAAAAADLPQPSSPVVVNGETHYVVSRVELHKTDNETVWRATVYYETNPLNLPLEINIQTTHYARERSFGFRKEKQGEMPAAGTEEAVRNAAGEVRIPFLIDDEAAARVELVKRMATFNYALPSEYACKQNKTKFLGFPPGTVYCADIRAVYTYDPITHYVVTGVFEIKMESWAHRVPEVGRRWLEYTYDGGGVVTNAQLRTSQEDFKTKDCALVALNRDGTKRDRSQPHLETFWDTIPYVDLNRLPFFT